MKALIEVLATSLIGAGLVGCNSGSAIEPQKVGSLGRFDAPLVNASDASSDSTGSRSYTGLYLAGVLGPGATISPEHATAGERVLPGQTPKGMSGADWSSIQAGIAAGRYEIGHPAAKPDRRIASNPDHGFQLEFSESGLELSPRFASSRVRKSQISDPTAISISGNGGQYSINNGSFTALSGTVNNGDTVVLRQATSSTGSTTASTTLTIGGVSDTWSVTTAAAAPPPSGGGGGAFGAWGLLLALPWLRYRGRNGYDASPILKKQHPGRRAVESNHQFCFGARTRQMLLE